MQSPSYFHPSVKRQIVIHVLLDWISASISWLGLFLYRKNFVEAVKHGYQIPVNSDIKLWIGLLAVPLFWITLYHLQGYYNHIFRRSRLRELESTFLGSLMGVVVLFFALILDDSVSDFRDYYWSASVLFGLHFFSTLLLRLMWTTRTIKHVQSRKWGYPTLIIGNGAKALQLLKEINSAKQSEGFKVLGFVCIEGEANPGLLAICPQLGRGTDLSRLIHELGIEEVILCHEDHQGAEVANIIDTIQNEPVHVKVQPDNYHMVMGMAKMNNILGVMLAEVDFEVMPHWQKAVKRGFDVLASSLALIILSPLFLLISIAVKWDSKGSVFFRQDRLGFRGKTFKIIKFRSMKTDAENGKPQLSHDHDERRTRVGIFLRRSRLDELPQFVNVFLGQMSIVGPRPERAFFADQIADIAPIYRRVHRVRPGITSWGQIKYGYAENVDEMVKRMQFDILYLENMSLGLDIKIMIYTVLIMIQGRGK
jgi:exopolysaccharide biosynthesis polyprenyl glycosylphosphotransferase